MGSCRAARTASEYKFCLLRCRLSMMKRSTLSWLLIDLRNKADGADEERRMDSFFSRRSLFSVASCLAVVAYWNTHSDSLLAMASANCWRSRSDRHTPLSLMDWSLPQLTIAEHSDGTASPANPVLERSSSRKALWRWMALAMEAHPGEKALLSAKQRSSSEPKASRCLLRSHRPTSSSRFPARLSDLTAATVASVAPSTLAALLVRPTRSNARSVRACILLSTVHSTVMPPSLSGLSLRSSLQSALWRISGVVR
mmetsp:Transcript_18773/g.59919  ORF Transcript_18773/g.59919 Transcript_18773/m.59919 type:complete len:255 (-) Transcript_18773:168-932(-)